MKSDDPESRNTLRFPHLLSFLLQKFTAVEYVHVYVWHRYPSDTEGLGKGPAILNMVSSQVHESYQFSFLTILIGKIA